jgi:Zn ribbon nucleic-acid-binding protein
MERYQQGKIYAIICRKTGRRYIGSTCEPTLAKRLAKHVSNFKEWIKHGKLFVSSYDIIKDDDYYIVLLELCPCGSKDELRMCEQKHIDLYECVNKVKAFQSEEEALKYRIEYNKQYREEHRDEILERDKNYYEQNRDKVLEKQKQHYEQNRNKVLEKQKQHYEQNRHEKLEKLRERVCCPNCQKDLSRGSLKYHKKICPQLKKDIDTDVI